MYTAGILSDFHGACMSAGNSHPDAQVAPFRRALCPVNCPSSPAARAADAIRLRMDVAHNAKTDPSGLVGNDFPQC